MKCQICNEDMYPGEITVTLVGYSRQGLPEKCNHNDNCRNRVYKCINNHKIKFSKRRVCPNSECDWKGSEECFCHHGKKVDEWPEVSISKAYINLAKKFLSETNINTYKGMLELNKVRDSDYVLYSVIYNQVQGE